MIRRSDVANLLDEVIKLLLGVGIFLGHLLVLGFPLVAGCLEGLDLALVVAGFDVGLAEPGTRQHVSLGQAACTLGRRYVALRGRAALTSR